MGWDSDSDDAVDIDAQLAAKNAAKKTYAISALGVWYSPREFDDEEKALKAVAKSQPKPKASAPSVSTGGAVEIITTRTYDEDEIGTSDPRAEKMRMQRLQEKAEMALMDDLFVGCDKPEDRTEASKSSLVREVVKTIKEDSFEKLKLVTTRDVETLASRCADKITSSDVKSAGHKFLNEMIRSIGHTLTVTDINGLSKVLKDLGAAKAREQAEKLAGKKKLSTDVAQMKKGAKVDVFDAMDEVYGDEYEEGYDDDY